MLCTLHHPKIQTVNKKIKTGMKIVIVNTFSLILGFLLLFCSCNPDSDTPLTDSTKDESSNSNKTEFPVADAIDMGLSVYWASWNMGENSSFKVDKHFGWGDIGKTVSSSLENFPCPFPPENISGTEYDIATQKWGDGWRLPQDKEIFELWSNSNVTIGEVEGVSYYKFISKINGNVIYLPLKSDFFSSCYWTGELYDNDTRRAISWHFDSEVSNPKHSWVYLERNNYCCVRPVFEHLRVWTLEAKNIEAKKATLNGTLSWYASQHANVAGFYISESKAEIEVPNQQTKKIQAERNDKSISAVADGLLRNQTYYYRAYVTMNGNEYFGDICEFCTLDAYEIGELWPDEESPEGVVFTVSDNGVHGKMVSLDQTSLVWQQGIPTFVNATNRDDGTYNQYPPGSAIQQWIGNHGTDWYFPAKNELHRICNSIGKINQTLRSIGSKAIENIFWSSTQYSVSAYDLAYMVVITENDSYMGYSNGWSSYSSKNQTRGVLAIKKF